MKTKYHITYIVLICFASLTAEAQVQRLPLDSVLARIAANPSLQAYDEKIRAQDAYATGAKSLDAPKISAGQYQTPYQINPNTGSFMIQAEQMFTNPAKLRAKENYMKGMSKVTAEDKNYMKNQLIAQARQYYYERVVLEKKLALLQNTQSLLEYMLKDANIRLTYGKEKLPNIYKAKADLYQLDNTREQLNNEISQKNIMLNTLMNRDKQTVFTVDTTVVLKDYETNVTDTASLANARSDIKGIDRNIDLQQLNAKMEYSKRKPDFGIQAGHMFSYGGMANQYILMASVTIPIVPWASKEYKANLKGIRYEVAELQQKKLDMLNQAEGQLAGLRTDMSSKKRQLKNYNQNIIPALQNTYKTSLLAYEQNTGDLPSVLDGIKGLQLARMDALDRLQELLQLQVAYEKENETH
ncbi:TolC family protein [Mucilaginibacter rubeus]|uniref:TolC family protein n=2 Tax=Mucilaginibacter rubeus TaxID=2027860 RepID=A0A364WWC1_9SPHI|nr:MULTISPECIES: TolC family protein [Mucilaginibacter]QEM06120.1 TolC family protein [Mucilaginibacter rubeus]QEM13637.1 TolC family protein [Mucilaginibacter rubeus]QEM18700.1 TolC family protein [Mucilaginibacter gossypii]QTE36305.1 TolC family protein [Mucilaginibacter gossypii]QTE44758.1 TolC family protein [Mucilaginibacter rubeus]